MSQSRTYLDWNASAPLRPEARAAMIAAMDEVGNPSSVHAEGRRAKAIVERARAQVADLVGCDRSEVVFTSGATEALGLVIHQDWDIWFCSPIDHDAAFREDASLESDPYVAEPSPLTQASGRYHPWLVGGFGVRDRLTKGMERTEASAHLKECSALLALSNANSETGVIQPIEIGLKDFPGECGSTARLIDLTQSIGRVHEPIDPELYEFAAFASHKFGGPKGSGALIVRDGQKLSNSVKGSGQELGRRAGTENVIGIAGFGAAAEAAQRDLANGEWDRVEEMRNSLEDMLTDAAPDLLVFGKGVPRLPNTSCFAIPGWRGETQVMQMDLSGFAISAGSACSSGKVNKASRVLLAMGFDEITASSAVRVSMGPTTTQAEITGFADAWIGAYRRWKAKAA